jgi:flagellar motor switch protein FliN/FliY
MSEIEKDLSETKPEQENAAEKQTGQPQVQPQPKPEAQESEDDNVSWDDAFKEEAAAGAKQEAPGKDIAGNLDIDIDQIKNMGDVQDAGGDSDEAAAAAVKPARKPVRKLEFASFDESDKTSEPPKNLDFILDIPLTISVELGRTKMVINDMLQLGQGSVIELAKLAGEPLDIYVNGKLMARGEVVLVNDKFGVRLTDIISPVERVKKL